MMKAERLALCVFILAIFILVGTASAQSSLVANVPRDTQHIWGNESTNYAADLEAGHWTVVVNSDSFWGLEVKITVATDSGYTNILAESGTDTGNFPRVAFTLDTNGTVYIRVSENSVYHDTSGYYKIGVYDDSHVPGFLASLDIFDFVFIIIIIGVLAPICIGLIACRRSRRGVQRIHESIAVEAPIHALPDKYQGSVQRHGSQTTTVRLPLNCPSCGAEVSHEGVDWVGPLEAKCSYCGGTMRATFERV
jgi:hypothetical protein